MYLRAQDSLCELGPFVRCEYMHIQHVHRVCVLSCLLSVWWPVASLH